MRWDCKPPAATQSTVSPFVALVKPQFEVGKGQVGSGGVVRDDAQRVAVTRKVIDCAIRLGLELKGILDSPVKGRKGNREILVGFDYRGIIKPSQDGCPR